MTAVRIPQAPLVRDGRVAVGPDRASLRLVASNGQRVPDGVRVRRQAAAVYRRRRCLAATVVLGLTASLAWVAAIALGSGGGPASSPRPRPASYVVQQGDTIWSIAERFGRAGEVATLSEQLVRANGGSQLRVGQSVVIPVG